jgi:hypothetical protein
LRITTESSTTSTRIRAMLCTYFWVLTVHRPLRQAKFTSAPARWT